MITELNERSRQILRLVVEAYLESGEPVGSRTLSRLPEIDLSPASIRNVMQDLEESGLLAAPHTSAGRMPTQGGLRFYVDGLMSMGNLSEEERKQIETECSACGLTMPDILSQASQMLSGLSSCASLVVAPKTEEAIRHINFVSLSHGRVLVVLVTEDGLVENRIMEVGPELQETSLQMAGNFLTRRLKGKPLGEARTAILEEINSRRTELDEITQDLVRRGVGLEFTGRNKGHIIIRGTSRLLEDIHAIQDLEYARQLLEQLENEESMLGLLDSVMDAEGVQVFIGTENNIFSYSGCSMILSAVFQKDESPGQEGNEKIIGAIGVIGPTRINYGRIVPMVDYTSRAISRLLGQYDG
jgi:heat-inducible transcriptional repressor